MEPDQEIGTSREDCSTDHPQKWNPRTTLFFVMVMLMVSWAIELAGRFAFGLRFTSSLVRDSLGVLAFCALLASALYLFSHVRCSRYAKLCVLLALAFGVCFTIFDLMDELPPLQHLPLFQKNHVIHDLVEITVVVSGSIVLIAGFFAALLTSEDKQRKLDVERLHLAREVAERERVEADLTEARRGLEALVEARTVELARSNEQLRVELEGRKQFEATLALRLRYEEGLANCSHVLLADADPPEALNRALRQLLVASGASRVYIFENEPDTENGLGAVLTHEAWDAVKCPGCEPDVGLRLSYSDGLSRWHELLSDGRVVSGVINELPEPEQGVCARFSAKSILLLPLGWEGRWRGFLGFDETREARVWSPEEIRILRTAAEMVGACKERQRAEAALRHAHAELEKRVSDRTIDLSRANEQLSKEVAVRRRTEREKIRLESQLRQAQKMQAIGTLAGGIAHDFNNILASILGYTELGLRKMEQGHPLQKYFEEVLKAGNRAKELVRQILLFSRQAEQEREPVHLHLIAQEVAALMQASCPMNIEIERHIDSDAGAVLGDAVQLHQVLLNLCTNAQHAMKRSGGMLTVCVDSQLLDHQFHTPHGVLLPGEYVRVQIKDTGSGIDPQTMERIFEPFFTTKSVAEGTGMGLAIVHGIVTGMGGVITVESHPGHGSNFILYLPRHTIVENLEPVAVQETLAGGEHILVVDDEPQLVALWTELLQQYGYKVSGYADSIHALENFRRNPTAYDLVLLDQTMPGMSGSELARNLLKERPELPIIVATGFSDSISSESAQEMGIRELVYKPILGNDLATAIRRCLGKPAPADPKQVLVARL